VGAKRPQISPVGPVARAFNQAILDVVDAQARDLFSGACSGATSGEGRAHRLWPGPEYSNKAERQSAIAPDAREKTFHAGSLPKNARFFLGELDKMQWRIRCIFRNCNLELDLQRAASATLRGGDGFCQRFPSEVF
jgi:hypothetical protein